MIGAWRANFGTAQSKTEGIEEDLAFVMDYFDFVGWIWMEEEEGDMMKGEMSL